MEQEAITEADIKKMMDYIMIQESLSFMMHVGLRGRRRPTVQVEKSNHQVSELVPSSVAHEQSKKRGKSRGVDKKIREKVFKRDNYTCQVCGRKYPEEHLVPNHKNHNIRNNKMSNLETVCAGCNMQEGRIYAELLRKAGPRSEVTEEKRLQIVEEARSSVRKNVPRKGWRKVF